MTKQIGVISDTHGTLPEEGFIKFLQPCDEIWHAGDIGNIQVIKHLEKNHPVRAVYGNIDNQRIRSQWPLHQNFTCEAVHVLITHIGGRPGRYDQSVLPLLREKSPDLFICGHSHILKIQYDDAHNFLYLNPGAAGTSGFHHVRTAVRFSIEDKNMKDMEVYEMSRA